MSKQGPVILTLLLCQILPLTSVAQVTTLDPVPVHGLFQIHELMADKGFSVRFMENAFQDQYGFIWVSTQYGTHMYNGYKLSDMKVSESDGSYSMLSSVRQFRDDRDGGVWLCGPEGLCYFDRATNKISSPRTFTDYHNTMKNQIWGIYQDHRGLYWVYTSSGMFLWNRVTDSVFHTEIPMTYIWYMKSGQDNFNLLETGDGSVWIPAALNGLFRYVPATGEFVNYRHDPNDPSSISSDEVTDVVEDLQGRLWVSTYGGGLNILTDVEQGKFEHISCEEGEHNTIPSDFLIDLQLDQSGNVWMAGRGFAKYQADDKEFKSYTVALEPLIYQESNLNEFWQIKEDQEGDIWLRTYGYGGLFAFDPESESLYALHDAQGQILSDDKLVYNLFVDPAGMIWVVTQDGIAVIEKHPLKQFHYFSNEYTIAGSVYRSTAHDKLCIDSQGFLWTGTLSEGVMIRRPGPGKDIPGEISGSRVFDMGFAGSVSSIIELDERNLCVRTDNRLYRFDRNSESISSFNTALDSILNEAHIREVYRDHNGYLWIGTNVHGLLVYDPTTGKFVHYDYDPDDPEGIPPGQYAFSEDGEGNMWMGHFGRGISMLKKSQADEIFSSKRLEITRFSKAGGHSQGLSSDLVVVSRCDSRNRIWIGTASGLNLYSPQDDHFYSFHVSDGLPDECICGILEDDAGNLWLSTMNGICKLVLKEGYGRNVIQSAYSYGVNEGIEKPFYHVRAYGKSPDGWMYFAGSDGMTVFHPDSIMEDPEFPPVRITNILVNGSIYELEKPIREKSLFETKKFRLPHRQNFLSFEYVALNYLVPEKTRYKYRMVGLDEGWVDAGTRRFAEYRDLKPGEYTFRAIACNEDGLWNQEGASIGIIIMPPWYRTFLAYFIYGILILAAIYGFIRWRTWRIRKERDHLELQVKERTAVIEDQKEEILTANTSLESQKKELEQQKEELQLTLEHLQQTQAQLIQSEKMAALGGLVAGVAHEINTPVGISVTAASSLAEETREMAEKYKQDKISRAEFKNYLNTANQSAKLILSNMERAANMIQSFKQVSVDQSTEHKRKFKLKEYSEDVIRSLYPKLKGKKIDITMDIDEKLELDSYPGAYSQILTNLVLNSLVHGFADVKAGEIRISGKKENDSVTVTYQDNGCGISKENLDRIFDPFFTTNKRTGTGLGLHIVHNLVTQKLNGTIICKSTPGTGTEFTIVAPQL